MLKCVKCCLIRIFVVNKAIHFVEKDYSNIRHFWQFCKIGELCSIKLIKRNSCIISTFFDIGMTSAV